MEEFITQKLYEHFTFHKVLDNQHGGRMHVTQWYDQNLAEFYKNMGMKGHGALDLRASIGTPSYAAIDGTVVGVYSNEYHDGTQGEFVKYVSEEVEIEDDMYRLEIMHYHLHKALVKAGDTVKAGQEICLTGNTGKYTKGAHLHFEVIPYIKKGEKWEKAFVNNGYLGKVDPYPFFFRNDVVTRPPSEPLLLPKKLYKSISSPKVCYMNSLNKPRWIKDPVMFEEGTAEGWWGGWHEIIEVRAKLKEDLTYNAE